MLEPTKANVLARAAKLKGKVENVAPVLDSVAGEQFYNTSALDFRRLLDDPAMRLSMGRAGAEKLRERWDWDRVIDRVEDAYGRALGASRTNVKVLA